MPGRNTRKLEGGFKVPITKFFRGDLPCARFQLWSVEDEKQQRSRLQVDMALSKVLYDFLWALLCNKARLTDELLDQVVEHCRKLRSDHDFHHP